VNGRGSSLLVELNGEPKDLAEGTTLSTLIEQLALAPERVAVELNRAVVRRADWPATRLNDGDRVEIVHFVGGGSWN
jgi:sulfur carrier protein